MKDVEKLEHRGLSGELKVKIESFEETCEKILHRRNNWIAHFNKQKLLDAEMTPLSEPSRAEIENALLALREAMNCVEFYYTNTTCVYEGLILTDDANSLLHVLTQGIRYQELVKEKVIPRDDLKKNGMSLRGA